MRAHPDTKPAVLTQGAAETDDRFAPDFFIIGAMKAGTTTLYRYLQQYEDVGMSRIKETDFFVAEKNFDLGDTWYKSQFDLNRPLLGEASPNYTKHDVFPGVPARIARAAPNARFIFLARDPVDRFVSQYRHSWLHGHMRAQPQGLLTSDTGRHMIECSRYGVQIAQYLTQFDRAQFLFLDFDVLCTRPQDTLNQVAGFLDLPHRSITHEAPANTAAHTAHVPGIVKRAARSKLARRFDYLIPRSTHEIVRRAFAIRKSPPVPLLDQNLRSKIADLLRKDAQRFRMISGLECPQWCV